MGQLLPADPNCRARLGVGASSGHPESHCGRPCEQALTGVELEHELHRVVVQVAAVLDDLDQGGQAALARGHLGHGDGGVELPENWAGQA